MRTSQDRALTCPMCKTEVKCFHKRSHVLPDWMFSNAYSPSHKIIHVNMNDLKAEKKQSATHGTFWCEDCERRSSMDDTYGSRILTSKSTASPEHRNIKKQTLSVANDSNPGVELWTGIEFKRFQDFIFSVIIRGELFARTEKREVIPNTHFEKIRALYENPTSIDDDSYPILVSRSPENDEHGEWAFLPHHTQLFEHDGVMFRGGRFQFQIYVSDKVKKPQILLGRVNKFGEMPVIVDYYKNTGSFKASQPRLKTVVTKYPMERLNRRRKK